MRTSAWNKDFELDYWKSHNDEFHLPRLEQEYIGFGVDAVLNDFIFSKNKTINIMMDIGGGPYGGVFQFCEFKAKRKVLVDILCDDYINLGHLPHDMETCTADFSKIPFLDNSIDVLFSWAALDHALSWKHFQEGQAELVRLLAPKGILFLHIPIRTVPCDACHILTPDKKEIMEGFSSLDILDTKKQAPKLFEMQNDINIILTK